MSKRISNFDSRQRRRQSHHDPPLASHSPSDRLPPRRNQTGPLRKSLDCPERKNSNRGRSESRRKHCGSGLSRRLSKRSLGVQGEAEFIKRIEEMTSCTAGNEARVVREPARQRATVAPVLPSRLTTIQLFPRHFPFLPSQLLLLLARSLHPPSRLPHHSSQHRTSSQKPNSPRQSNSNWRNSIDRSSTSSRERRDIVDASVKVSLHSLAA